MKVQNHLFTLITSISLLTFAFAQDVAIWENKIYIPDPLVCDGDGPLHKLRKWYGQFLVDRADVPKGLDMEMREF